NLQRAIALDPRNFYTLQQLSLSYKNLRRYAEEVATEDRALSIRPDDPETKATRAFTLFEWKADTRSLLQVIDEIRSKDPGAIKSVADVWFLCALAGRDAATADMALTGLGDATFGDDTIQLSAGFGRGLLARMTKDVVKARAAFAAIRQEQ